MEGRIRRRRLGTPYRYGKRRCAKPFKRAGTRRRNDPRTLGAAGKSLRSAGRKPHLHKPRNGRRKHSKKSRAVRPRRRLSLRYYQRLYKKPSRTRSGCGYVLDGAHARSGRRSAFYIPAHAYFRLRRHRPCRPACARHRRKLRRSL